jgi:pimeloyl-ACP methyl ester carboxylesterase
VEQSGIEFVASTRGVRVAVHELGGSGRPLLFAHATGFCGPVWRPVADELADHRTVALDFRAHGRSSRPDDGDLHWGGAAEDLLAVVDALGLDGSVGVGHSMGGAALLLAEQSRPGTFAALWIYEPIVMTPSVRESLLRESLEGENSLAVSAARRRRRFPSARAAFDNYASKPPLDVLRADALRAYVEGGFETLEDGSVSLRCLPEDESETFRMGPTHDAAEHLAEITCPVTVVKGRDEPGPAMFADAVAEALPHGRLVQMPSLGHFGPMEDPGAIAASIRATVDRSA